MRHFASDFASSVFASPRRSAPIGIRIRGAGHRAVLFAAGCAMLLAASGCSWVPLWPGGHSADDLTNGKASPGEISAALEATRAMIAQNPEEPYWPFRMGELYVAADSTALAVSQLQLALGVDPGYAPAAALLSKIYYDAELYEQGVALLDDFLARNADAPDAVRVALALHLEALGDPDRAESVLDSCSGSSVEARSARTFVSLRGDELVPVLQTAKQALDANPKSAANYNNYGIALLHNGQPVEARDAFMAALDLNDKLPGALYNMAIVEAFYFFDEEAGRRWFVRYQKYATDDPDDLTSRFGTDLSTLLQKETKQ